MTVYEYRFAKVYSVEHVNRFLNEYGGEGFHSPEIHESFDRHTTYFLVLMVRESEV